MRYVFFDTETTGLRHDDGHRVFELCCIEVVSQNNIRTETGRMLHSHLNPQMPLSKESEEICKIKGEFLLDKPLFSQIAQSFINFITLDQNNKPSPAVLVAHNIKFDIGFLNNELRLCDMPIISNEHLVDTVKLAKQKFPGQSASLDNLCKQFNINLSDREKYGHGAVLDTKLLIAVFHQLCSDDSDEVIINNEQQEKIFFGINKQSEVISARPLYISNEEINLHNEFMSKFNLQAF
jgi:DNA polymerase-3 subunit epsilon